jgi:hypothetical protein
MHAMHAGSLPDAQRGQPNDESAIKRQKGCRVRGGAESGDDRPDVEQRGEGDRTIAACWPATQFRDVSVIEVRDLHPGPPLWIRARASTAGPSDTAPALCAGPSAASRRTVAGGRSRRRAIVRCPRPLRAQHKRLTDHLRAIAPARQRPRRQQHMRGLARATVRPPRGRSIITDADTQQRSFTHAPAAPAALLVAVLRSPGGGVRQV